MRADVVAEDDPAPDAGGAPSPAKDDDGPANFVSTEAAGIRVRDGEEQFESYKIRVYASIAPDELVPEAASDPPSPAGEAAAERQALEEAAVAPAEEPGNSETSPANPGAAAPGVDGVSRIEGSSSAAERAGRKSEAFGRAARPTRSRPTRSRSRRRSIVPGTALPFPPSLSPPPPPSSPGSSSPFLGAGFCDEETRPLAAAAAAAASAASPTAPAGGAASSSSSYYEDKGQSVAEPDAEAPTQEENAQEKNSTSRLPQRCQSVRLLARGGGGGGGSLLEVALKAEEAAAAAKSGGGAGGCGGRGDEELPSATTTEGAAGEERTRATEGAAAGRHVQTAVLAGLLNKVSDRLKTAGIVFGVFPALHVFFAR